MKVKKQIRDLIYVNSNIEEKCFISYGIEFREFMSSVESPPENLILLKHNFDNTTYNAHTRFDYVTKNEINQLINDNVYAYGDFCWVDFFSEENLNKHTKDEVAELLFFGHMSTPLKKLPMARFAYYAHDDGWYNKLFVSNLEDYNVLLSKVITNKLRVFTGWDTKEISDELVRALIERARNGLLLNFRGIVKTSTQLRLPLIEIGRFTDMDKLYELYKSYKNYYIWLEYSQETWRLIDEG